MRMRHLLFGLIAVLGCRTAPEPPYALDLGQERWQYFHEERAYPFETIPPDARRRAVASLARERALGAEAAGAHWRPLGPAPVKVAFSWGHASGRINALAVSPADPNVVLAGASSGGIWRSTDAGETFHPVSDAHVDLSIGAIAFAPSDPRIVYAAAGSDFLGTGVLRSDDAGATWRLVSGPTFAQRGRSWRAVVDPADPERLWVAQNERHGEGSALLEPGLLLSEDGGATWTNLIFARIGDLVFVPGTAGTLLASVDFSYGNIEPGVHKSTDGGRTWTLLFNAGVFFPNGSQFLIAVSPANPEVYGVLTSDQPRLAVSTDAGATWTTKEVALPDEPAFYFVADPSDARTYYVGFRDGYKSTNGGTTWTNLTKSLDADDRFVPHLSTTHIDQHSFAFAPHDARTIYLGNDGGIFKSRDGGITFTAQSRTLSVIQAYGIAAHPTDPDTLYLGTQDNGLERRYADGSWLELVTGDYGSIAFDANDPTRVVSNYIRASLLRMQGVSWRMITNYETFGEPESRPRIAFIAPLEQLRGTNTLFFGTYRLFVSRDFGTTWSAPGGAQDLTSGGTDHLRAIGVHEHEPNVIYTGSLRGTVMVTRDGGTTWTNVTAGLPNRAVKAFALDPRTSSTAYVSFSGYGTEHVYRTRDYGQTWTPLEGSPDAPTNALLVDPDDYEALLAGTDVGIFRHDPNRGWEPFHAGLPHVVVSDFAVTADRRIVAATYGRGAYELVRDPARRRRRSVRH